MTDQEEPIPLIEACSLFPRARLTVSTLRAEELADYLLDNYGVCDRASDCYWGRDKTGRPDGCLKVGWRGRECAHWHPWGTPTFEELRAKMYL